MTTQRTRDALIDLVRLKDLKEWIASDTPYTFTGHTPEHWARVQQYEREKELAWEEARLALEAAPEVDSRSRLRRIAAQKGDSIPDFSAPEEK